MKNKGWSILLVLTIFMGFVILLTWSGNIGLVLNQIKTIKVQYLMFGLLAIIGYWITEAKIINKIVCSTGNNQSFNKAMEVTMIGHFFNGITPFASGGQPAQLYLLVKQNLPLGQSSSLLMSKFIIFQGVLLIYSLLFMITRARFFAEATKDIFFIVMIGFVVNVLVIGFLLFLSFAKQTNLKTVKKLVSFLHYIKLIKNPVLSLTSVQNYVREFHNHSVLLKNNKPLFLKVVFLSAVQLTLYFLIPYFIYKSLGLEGADIISFMAGSGFVLMLSSFIPIPGASGGAEGGFTLILGIFFLQGKYIVTAVILWRLTTYYLGIFIGGLWMMISKARIK